MKDSLFFESVEHHQSLVNCILKYKKDDGFCYISRDQLVLESGRQWSWISKAFKRMNTEEICVIETGGKYFVAVEDLLQGGVFCRIFWMMIDTLQQPEIVRQKNDEIMKRYNCKLKTVQMYRAYMLSGWKKDFRENMKSRKILNESIEAESGSKPT